MIKLKNNYILIFMYDYLYVYNRIYLFIIEKYKFIIIFIEKLNNQRRKEIISNIIMHFVCHFMKKKKKKELET